MAAVAVDRHLAWSTPPRIDGRTRFQPGPPAYRPESMLPPDAPIPPHNDVELTRDMLWSILEYFSKLAAQLFAGRPIRMVVHGGACMLLHPGLHKLSQQQHQMIPTLPRRTTTRDVDYIHRSFVAELASYGIPDAALKLQECIRTTARHFGLGADWMNSDADIALPMAHDPSGKVYDPIYAASIKPNNINLHTIFRSSNGSLLLISVTPFWAVSLKLVRYTKWDPGDICLLLRNGMVLSGTQWTPETVEDWLFQKCWAMGYHNFDVQKKVNMRARIVDAIKKLSEWSIAVQPPEKTISAHDAMGGGDVMGDGEHGGNNGWGYSFGTWPNQVQPQAQLSSVPFPMPSPTPVPVNVRDWATTNDPLPQRKSRSPSPYSRSRQSSTNGAREIFIPPPPPEIDWINPNHTHRPRSRNPSPNPVDDGWNDMYPAESNDFQAGSRVSRADPYSLASFDRSISSMLHQSHHRNVNPTIPSNNQPVIPIAFARKQNEKRRHQNRERDRQSKRLPLQSRPSDSDTSVSSDEEVSTPRRIAEGRPWHIYAQPSIHHHPPPPLPPQIRIAPPHSQPPQIRIAPEIHRHSSLSSLSGPGLQDPSHPREHRSSHLTTLTSPPPASLRVSPQMPVPVVSQMPIGLRTPPQSLGPAGIAHFQFEQQQQQWQQQQQRQQQQQQQQQQQYQQQQQQQQQQQYQQQQQQHHSHHQHQHHQQQWNNAGVAVFR